MSQKSLLAPARKRQLGAERRTTPLSTVHARPSDSRITWGRIAIVVTVLAWVTYVISTIVRQFLNNGTESFRFTTEARHWQDVDVVAQPGCDVRAELRESGTSL